MSIASKFRILICSFFESNCKDIANVVGFLVVAFFEVLFCCNACFCFRSGSWPVRVSGISTVLNCFFFFVKRVRQFPRIEYSRIYLANWVHFRVQRTSLRGSLPENDEGEQCAELSAVVQCPARFNDRCTLQLDEGERWADR